MEASFLMRRRDKRRTPTTDSHHRLLRRDPWETLQWAVQYDANKYGAVVLQGPLQGISLQASPQTVHQALDRLYQLQQQPHGAINASKKNNDNNDHDTLGPLTPIILSALIQALQDPQQQHSAGISASELVPRCHAYRQLALRRVRRHERQRRLSRIILPLLSASILLSLYLWTGLQMVATMEQLGYAEGVSRPARSAEAHLWYHWRHATPGLTAILQHIPVTMEEHGGRPRPSGPTVVYGLVLDAVRSYLGNGPYKKTRPVLVDVGCGLGDLWNGMEALSWDYVGVTPSRVEQQHLEERLIASPISKRDRVEVSTWDEPLPVPSASAVVAVESLAYSPNINQTISYLIQGLASGGVMVVVEDFSNLPPSSLSPILSLSDWIALLADKGCEVKGSRDLTMEYELYIPTVRSDWDSWYLMLWDLLVPRHWLKPSIRRMMQLQADLSDFAHEQTLRKAMFETGELGYALMVCVKEGR